MSERNQYHWRQAVSIIVTVYLATAISCSADGIMGFRRWREIGFTYLLGSLLIFLAIPIFYYAFTALHRKKDLFSDEDWLDTQPGPLLILAVIVGLQVYDKIRHSHSLNEILVRSAMVCLGCAIGGLIFWLGFGRWYTARVAERRASLDAQATVGGLS